MKSILGFLILVFASVTIQGQDYTPSERRAVDSLSVVISNHNSLDTARLWAYYEMHQAIGDYHPDTSEVLLHQIVKSADSALKITLVDELRLAYLELLGAAYMHLAIEKETSGDLDSVFYLYRKSAQFMKNTGDKSWLSTIYHNMGHVHGASGRKDSAKFYYEKSLALSYEIGDLDGVASTFNNIGFLYSELGDNEKALEMYNKSLAIYEDTKNRSGIATQYINIGSLYSDLGDIDKALDLTLKAYQIDLEEENYYEAGIDLSNLAGYYGEKGETEKAFAMLLESLEMKRRVNNEEGIATSYNNLGDYFIKIGRLDTALQLHYEALEIQEKLRNQNDISFTLGALADLYLLIYRSDSVFVKKPLVKASQLANRGLRIAEEAGYTNLIKTNAKMLKLIYAEQQNWELAYQMQHKEQVASDSISNGNLQRELGKQFAQSEFEKSQLIQSQKEADRIRAENEEKERRDAVQYAFILIGIVILFVAILAFGLFRSSPTLTDALIFFAFLLVFEFILVLGDPFIEKLTDGAPGWKLLVNAGIAAVIFPMHTLLEKQIKSRLYN